MLACSDCGHTFKEPVYDRFCENHGNGIVEPWIVKRCPVCGSDDIEEIEEGEDEA